MHVVVNHLMALGRKTGIGHYTRELLRGLDAVNSTDEIDAFPTGFARRVCRALTRIRPLLGEANEESFSREHQPRTALAHYHNQAKNLFRQSSRAVLGRYFRAVCSRRKYDLYHEPNVIPFQSDCPTLATVHDLSVLLYPEWHPADRVAYYEHHFRRGLGHCVHFLAVSEFCRQEIIRLLNIPPERVTRTYNGIRPGLRPLERARVEVVLEQLGLPRQYLLYLGTIEPRKNVLMLLQAYCAMPADLRADWPLLLVGNWGWHTRAIADFFHREARHRGVIHLGYLKEAHLSAVYNGARALVYPSWYEGFGLPPLEMMACGGAVLASTAGALVETVGRRAHLIQPGNLDGWRDAMARVVQDDDWFHALRQGTQATARPYTWERCAAQTLQVYRSLARSSREVQSILDLGVPSRRAAG
jgi:glycosyltransferase involved in cell wall biosynthesis